jgi:hypothetical protein
MSKPEFTLDRISFYLEDAGYPPALVRLFLDSPKFPQTITLATPNHQYQYSFAASWWAIASNMTDDLGREKRGHEGRAICPRCPINEVLGETNVNL